MSPILLLLLSACEAPSPAWRPAEPKLRASAEALTFPATPIDDSSTLELTLSNLGSSSGSVALACSDPQFDAEPSEINVAALSEAVVTLRYTPTAASAEATLTLTLPDQALTLSLSGAAEPDGDADGFDHEALGGQDCDDADAGVFPGAEDDWYDGVDADCAGDDDFDADLDGFAAPPEGDDCDDTRGDVYPRADDAWYDGVDADCAGDSDYDADRDGYDAEPWGADCDDTNERVSPGRAELWYDGTDHDCDGRSDFDADLDGYDRVPVGQDCDDTDDGVHPGAADVTDGVDQDCDERIDEG